MTAICVASLTDGRPCGQIADEEVIGLWLCRRHYDAAEQRFTERRYRQRLDWDIEAAEANERRRKLDRVRPVFKREPTGWTFTINLPRIDGKAGRIKRRGFRTKIEAQRAAKEILTPLSDAVARDVARYRELAAGQQAAAIEHWLNVQTAVEVRRLETAGSVAAARRQRERERIVYYVRRPDGAIKIGTTWNLTTRMQAFRNVSPVDLLAHHTGGQVAEAAMHRRFRGLRLDGEWFHPGGDLLAHIAHVAEQATRRGRVA